MARPERSTFTALDFSGWRDSGALVIVPKFQRRGVWTTPAKSYFIDTLLRGMPVPPIYLRMMSGPMPNRPIHEVVDGQQRISSVLDFIDGKFRLSKTLQAPW